METTTPKYTDHAPDRPTRRYSIRETFGLDVPENHTITGFEQAGALTPDMNPHHWFPLEETVMMLMALRNRDTTYLVGPSGSGKTELINQIAARLGYNVVQVNFDEATRVAELVGSMGVRDGATYFSQGIIPYAYQLPGTILLLDEVDMCPAGVASAMQNALSAARKFLIRQTGDIIRLHPQNCVAATANTKGMGDDSNLYAPSTNVQNFSFINRFETTIVLDYLPDTVEGKMLLSRFPAEGSEAQQAAWVETINRCVFVANSARNAFKHGTLSMPLTTRDLINWLKKLKQMPLVMRTAKYSFLNRMPEKDAQSLATIINSKFTISPTDDQTYLKSKSR